MASLLIRNLPPELHRRLKEQAARHHRSMTREAIALIEEALGSTGAVREAPPPYRGEFDLTDDFVEEAKRSDRS